MWTRFSYYHQYTCIIHTIHLILLCNHECIHVPFTTTSVITQLGDTALMEAARCGHTEVVVELVKANANLDIQDKV